ncbi:MAG: FAD:protein FMN transferase [Bacteroidales bacterium]|nr:FAD:protein FMN transferase [Bacteroidales bacterium]
MKRLLGILLLLLPLACAHPDRYTVLRGYAQGGTYAVKFSLSGVRAKPERIQEAVDSILQRVDTTLSGYNKGSMLSRFNRGETVFPNDLFLDVYDFSRAYFEASDGGLDVAAGPVFDIWGFGFTTDSLPPQSRVDSALSVSGMKRLVPSLRSVLREDGSLRPEDVVLEGTALPRLNYNAVAQGYTCDLVAEYLHSLGVKDMLVDIGEIFCEGVNPAGNPWSIGVDRPVDGNNTPGQMLEGVWQSPGGAQGVVTSGNYRKFYIKDGRKYGHTLDPRTGYPAQDSLLSATIVTARAADADAVATWAMVLGFEKARQLLLEREDLEGYLIYASQGDTMKHWASPGFNLK